MEYNSYPLEKPVLRITEQAIWNILRHSDRCSELNVCINELKNCYLSNSLYNGNGDIDFDDPTYQACYVFLYFPVLCYGISYGLLQCYYQGGIGTLLKKASQYGCLRVCALGGGPGTDLFGVRMFLNETGHEDVPITATVLDRHPDWSLAFRYLQSKLNQPSNLSATYLRLEASSSRSVLSTHLKAIADADLITCSKFISAVKALPNSRETISKILKSVKPGAYIFYLENSKGGNTEFFRSVAQRADFTEVVCFERGEDNPFQLPNTEHSSILRDLSSRFNFNSQRNLRVTFMLWRKVQSVPVVASPYHPSPPVPSYGYQTNQTIKALRDAHYAPSSSQTTNSNIHNTPVVNPYRMPKENNSRLNRQHGSVTSSSKPLRPTPASHVTTSGRSGLPSRESVSAAQRQSARAHRSNRQSSSRDYNGLEAQQQYHSSTRSCCPCILL